MLRQPFPLIIIRSVIQLGCCWYLYHLWFVEVFQNKPYCFINLTLFTSSCTLPRSSLESNRTFLWFGGIVHRWALRAKHGVPFGSDFTDDDLWLLRKVPNLILNCFFLLGGAATIVILRIWLPMILFWQQTWNFCCYRLTVIQNLTDLSINHDCHHIFFLNKNQESLFNVSIF